MIGRLSNALSSLLLLCAVSACTGTETGNPDFAASVSFNMRAPEPEVAAAELADEDFSVQRLWLTIDTIEVVAGGSCLDAFLNGDDGLPFPGLGTGDHSTPAAAEVSLRLPDDSYCGLQFALSPAEELPPEAASSVQGTAVELEATYGGRPLVVSLDEQLLVRFVPTDQAALISPEQHDLLVVFDPVAWLSTLDPQALAEAEGATVRIDRTNNAALHAQLMENLAEAFTIWLDDGSGSPPSEGYVAGALPPLDAP